MIEMLQNRTHRHRRLTLSRRLKKAVKKYVNEEGISDWSLIKKVIIKEDLCGISDEEFWRLLIDFAHIVKKHDCRDTSFIVEVMEWAWRSYSLCNPDPRWDRLMCWKARSAGFKNLFFTSYKKTDSLDVNQVDAVTTLTILGQLRPLQLLLRFGATSIYPKDEMCERRRCIDVIKSLFPEFICKHEDEIEQTLVEKFDETSRRRLIFVCRYLDVLPILGYKNTYNSEYIQKMVDSWKLYFSAVPEPFVTGCEIRCKFETLLRGIVDDIQIESVVKELGDYFPESCQPSGPRSLMHLSRFQVRENLRTSYALRLPQAIDSLPVPEKFKEYISLREKEMYLDSPDLIPSRFNRNLFEEELSEVQNGCE